MHSHAYNCNNIDWTLGFCIFYCVAKTDKRINIIDSGLEKMLRKLKDKLKTIALK